MFYLLSLFQLFTSYYSGFRWEGKHICLWNERFQKAFEWNSISQKSSDLIGALCVQASFLAFKYHADECHACYFHASDATKLFMVVLLVPWYTRQSTQIQLIRPPSSLSILSLETFSGSAREILPPFILIHSFPIHVVPLFGKLFACLKLLCMRMLLLYCKSSTSAASEVAYMPQMVHLHKHTAFHFTRLYLMDARVGIYWHINITCYKIYTLSSHQKSF